MLTTYEHNSRKKLAVTIVALVVIAGMVLLVDHLKSAGHGAVTAASTASPAASSPDTSSSSSVSSPGTYKDGTYTAESDYFVPHGDESIEVTLTLKSGTVTDVSIQNSESNRDSAYYQEYFATTYKNRVVGKSINGLQISRVSGASDTTDGFNEALSKIASQAQA